MALLYTVTLRCLDCPATGEIQVAAKSEADAEMDAAERWGHDKHGTYHGRTVGQVRRVDAPPDRPRTKRSRATDMRQTELP